MNIDASPNAPFPLTELAVQKRQNRVSSPRTRRTAALSNSWALLVLATGLTLCPHLATRARAIEDALEAATKPVPETSTLVDRYSPPIEWRLEDGRYAGPYHATLLPSSEILLFAWTRDTDDPNGTPFTDFEPAVYRIRPTPLGEPFPESVTVLPDTVPLDIVDRNDPPWHIFDYLNCSGHSLTADGDVFVAGGSRIFHNTATDEISQSGLSYATRFDGTQWSRIADDMVGTGARLGSQRWYATVTRLADESMLVTSGIDAVRFKDETVLSPNRSVALYRDDSWSLLSTHEESPDAIWNPDYTHVFVLPADAAPEHDVMLFGDDGIPVLLSSSGETAWQIRDTPRPGTVGGEAPNKGASSALLPLRLEDGEWGYGNGSVVIAGGDSGTSHEQHLDVYDPTTDSWLERQPLGARRHHPMTVLLPDARVLVIGGHNNAGAPGTEIATYFDPSQEAPLSPGSAEISEVRGYHSLALLLPDGRVLLAGGTRDHTGGAERADFRYYYPDYMSRDRPQLTMSPDEATLGETFSITWTGASLGEAALVALGSMTHSFDTNQRHVQLEIVEQTETTAVLRAPASTATAPPGHYLLFLLDEERTPSKGRLMRLNASPGAGTEP